ncbi:IgGFc-binding protein-like [Trichechus inunguis]
MMGTCMYTLAELCGTDESLPAFSVEAKNEHRGNQRVSYVGFVTVRAYSHAVSLARGEYGFVRIDNQRSCLPVSLSDGRLRVYQSGMRAVVELDFGLVVNYNWDSQLTLSLPMRFRDQVCGLCGNYDGDPSNDFLTPDRVQVADAMEFGKSWKLDDGDYLCQDGCQSNCPKCTQGQAQQYKGDHLCGMLTLSDGPFATCHASLDPQPFLEECVYDLCVVGGDRPSLCRGLLAYAEACLELGISVGDWRSPANCRPPCPANSRYELCGPACQASCNGAAAPANCSARPCVEGCVCLSGFVASGDACVPASDCGCTFEGRQLAPGQAVWADDQCRRRCTCDGATQQVRCSDTQGCPAGERCRVQDGLLGCYPDRFGTCEGSGDPHYVSFDGRRFDFMGTCTYLLAGSCGQNAALPDFRVLVENEHRGSQTVSYTRAVRVEARGVELAVRREHPGKVLVGNVAPGLGGGQATPLKLRGSGPQLDGVLRCLPFQAADGQIQVFRQGSDAIIRTDFGLTVTFNWNSRVRAKVPGSYAEALCGLCGNFNGDPGDDLAVRGGGQAANALAFGNSWLEEKRPGCGPVEPGKCPNLDALVTQQVQSKKECGILADPQGPFRECHSTVDPQGAVRDCIYDRCLLPGQSGPLCDALAAYAAACQAAGATVDSWRSETFCPPPCPAHSHYEAHSHGCPLSCGDIPVPGGCGSDFFESCVCDEGFVLSGESCVPLASCGCVHQGIYHPPGQSFYPGPGCESLCHCQEGGLVSCEPSSCGPHEACKPSAGILGCVPVGSATCQASGDPHYTTFDGRRFDFMGTCVYVLAQTCGAQAGLEQFTILQENAAWGNGKVSVTRVVTVQVANLTLRLEQNRWTVKVDGVDLKLPVELAQGRVWAFRHGSDAVIETDFGLRVAYDLKYYARVTIPGNYHGQLCGLCGNYNGDPKDDFQKPNGSQAGNSNEFGDSWEKPVPGSPCGPVCPGDKCEVLKCAPELEEKYKQEKSCGLLASTTGPLAACHKLVDPQGPLEDCVFDLCLGGGNASILCSNIHAYVSACQAAGGQVKPWRNESFCPMPCPPHSHYEICADTCSLGCSALSAPSLCPDRCAEGCQCDSGYLSDGQGCVPIQDCGCYHSGIYFDPNKTVLIDNCQKQCVCHAGEGLVCQNHSCEAQQVCQPVDGVLSCKNKVEPSCEDIKCEPGQHCQVVDGKAKCVKEPTATCRAQGDPHYTTFDGRRYDMMGTCTYTLAELCGTDESLPAFSVEAKNEHRGNQRVSYVGFVTVRAYSHAVSLARGEYGFVRIDNQRSCLPVSLSDGRLRVYQSGMRAVVELDFGLVVNYNWDSQLTLSLPMRFRDQVCGLCGNYDGDPSNDFLTPDRVQVADAMEFGKSWKLDDGDYLCQDGCQSNCPKCTQGQAQQYKGDHLCGMLTLSDGPFATCHASLDPQPFLEECVYDLCVVGGDRPSLCRGLLAYAEACLELGISVGDWRSPANCRPPCPANSRYELCGPACQASCNGAAAPANCSARPCVEGCVCLSGFVASGDACVPASDCGCTFEGRQLAPGQAVWADDQCRRRCTCDGATQQVRCSDTQGCPAGERCRVQDGLLGCYPDRFGTCEGSGDPHYVSFDGRRFDFMGTCTYLLAGSCGQNAALPDFRVLVENEHRGSQTVSYTRAVRVEARGVELAVRREHPGKVLVGNVAPGLGGGQATPLKLRGSGPQLDGVLRCLPFQAADGQIQVFRQGSDAIIRTDFGLTVTFNWNSRVRAKVPGSYAEALCGLCGNFNGDPGDDLAVRGGGQAANALAFGNSWLEEKRPGCGPVEPGKCPNLDALVTQQVQSKKECGILADPQGPFRECHSTVDPQGAVRDCIYDRCLLPGQSGPLCDALAAYAAACQAAGATVDSWRSETFCPPPCPAHSHYEAHSHGCPLSCGDIPVPGGCGSDFFESCVCDEGFVLSGESCVPLASCGCVHQGIYHPPGQSFYPGPGCESLCHCQEGGLVSCEPSSCGPHEACKPSAGILGCVPVGSATCQASGDPHYTTFDGRRFDFMGTCVYVLAQTCGAQAGLEQFTILQENAAWGNGKVSVTRVVTVQVANLTLRLEQNRWTVKVDGVDLKLPVELAQGRVWAFRHGSDAVIETDFGLRVAYDLKYYARVTIPGNYHGQLCGLCGNYNGDPKDDFQKPNGSQAGNSNEFGDSWEKPVPGSPCGPVCPGDKCEVLKCAPELEEKYKQEKSCGLLASTTGPLAACHKLVDPQGPLEDCVFDLCLGGGNASILCSNIHAYVSACQAAGGQVKPWRNESFCPMPCPPHSHYEICADTCSLGCSALSAPSLCPDRCAEGCQCDSGYLSDGQGCVPIQDCGCYHSGIYFDPNKTVLIDNCQKQCVCHAGEGLVCQNHSCEAQQVCQPVDGVLSCKNKVEPSCEDIKCEPGQHCQVVDGKAKCVKEPTATCRAQGDPHYTTFDGRRYDMMGTCTYTLAELCGTDESLPAFSVEAKNEHRGNQRVSYVGFVTVRAYSHAVSLARGEYGFVRIDNQRSCLPVSLSDGRLRVYQSGMRAVVELDFGLVVNYNWDSQLTLSLPMRFGDQVCGLCGNYNGDPSDDFLTPDRVQAADAMEFGKSWKLDDGDYLCQGGCQSNCPKCTQGQAQQYKGDHLCGMLTLSDGPFATCHASLDPQPFLEECVYDLCVVGGDRPSLCRGLLAYAEACLELGISVGDWRSPANCRPPCPANSRYELCGPACQTSCNGAAVPANCSARPCVEGCVCLPGFVSIGDACVPASDCGCTFEGRQLAPGQAVWADDQCRRRCTCDGATQQVRCSDTQGCPAGERCRVQDGLLGCYPDRFGTCEGSGDPHYVSFDGRRFDFMGTCTYLLAGSCGQNAALPDFRVLVENEHRGSQTVSYTRAVRVEARGVELAVRREHPGKVLLDGVLQCLPFQAADGQIQVFRQGSDAVIRTDFGLTVTFDWNSRVRAKVPGSYAEALCGLCGNFNGDPGDDLALRGGGQAANALAFGNSWLEETRPGCGPVKPGECPNLDALVTQQVQSKKECGILVDPEGPFRECHSRVDPQGAVRDCVYDRCLLPGQSGPLCDALAAYAAACQAAGATVDSWRSETFCPPPCPAHSHYEAHSHGCPLSCGDIPVPGGCGSDFFESCVCDEGFVLSGESCVPLASCGCVHQGIYHPPGQTFHPGPGCESLCHCQEGGLVSCEPSSCGPHEACKPSAGILGCVPVGSATCQTSGDPHYTTFDGRRFSFMGTCVYVLAQTCGAQAGLEQFTILQENAAWGNRKVSVTRVVTVQVANLTLRLEQNRWTVKVDGVDLNLPVELAQGRVRAFRHGSDAVIETDFGLRVAYDLNYYARVTIPGNYHGQLCGLCGNYNGDPKDDFQKPNGSQAGNSNEFGDSWEKPVPGSPCAPVCPGDKCEELKCAPELEEKYKQEKSCGLLASTTGPLAACHKLVDPQGPLEDCVFDLCLGGGNASILCSNIHAYVSACQAAGGQVKPWRNETFCPMPCPPHSHYEICADTCSLGCSALSAPSLCPDRCAEGCQCDSGYLSDGQGCVPIQDCGCYHSGIYFDPNKTVLIDNCQKQCVCHAGEGEGLVCQNHSCEAHQVCQPVDGVLSCVNKVRVQRASVWKGLRRVSEER